MNIQSIDEKLRAEAVLQLNREIDTALRPVRKFIDIDEHSDMTKFMEPGRQITPRVALDAIADMIRARYAKDRGQKAVDAFIQKVDAVQAELDQLKQQVEGE